MYNTEKFDLMTIDEKHEFFMATAGEMRRNGIFKKWYELADLLGVSANAISGAKNKNEGYLTSSLLVKLEDMMIVKRKEQEGQVVVTNSPGTNVVNGNNNDVEINAQTPHGISALGTPSTQMKYVPTIPIHAYRAVNFDVMKYFKDTQDELHMSPIVMQFPGTDCYYFVNSEDMSPHLRTNDLLCLSRLPDDVRVTNGDLCIINTKYQGILERFVYDEGDALLLKSSQPRWTDMRIPKEEIFSVFRILGGIRTNI